ncbi:TonB-dependent receptor [Novosphingobium flavum]|uniref:TonB-dependent receptor n=1 Tax=Novosphingobium flavum TaxID=1778672 RepID=A0A7X1FQY9_9SPHN|nr:TonB-dependent receptor [Novosphingobium flavum]MBC2665360.1 TonB-dependent receptor [Novosphingobium flavum]
MFAVSPLHAQEAAREPTDGTKSAATSQADEGSEAIIVTGSRVIKNGNDSPTPVTIISADSLAQSKPTTVFEALLEQPLFAGSGGGKVGGRTGQGGNNNSIASLNLRGLGSTRSLVLLDGKRVPPQNLDGSTDLNQIPEMLLGRVDLQTGGSSAVYGSDAITGVVNFILDRKFTGIKLTASSGISQRGDEPIYDVGAAFGTNLLGDRGHFMASVQYRNDAGLQRTDRENIQKLGGPPWSMQGNGCLSSSVACVPYFISQDARDGLGTFGGLINSTSANPFNRYDFTQNGIATPFVGGTAVAGSNNQIGGNGAYNGQQVSLAAQLKMLQAFARFDYDLTDNLHFYVSGYYNRINQHTDLNSQRANGASAVTGTTNGFKLRSDNAFLPDFMRTGMQTAGITTFNLGKYFDVAGSPPFNIDWTNTNRYITAGLEGKLGGGWNWEVAYVGSRVTQKNVANETWSTARLLASLDSVLVNGVPTCWVNTQAQYTANFPGCVPINPFGPTSLTKAQHDYIVQPTDYIGTTTLMDFSGSINGSPFSTWAGPVNVAVSAEYRKLGYELVSNGPVANVVALDCNALGLLPARTSCVQPSSTNIGTAPTWPNGTAGRSPVSQKVSEIAGEADVPLITGKSFADDVRLSGAVRYADYSSTGSVNYLEPYKTAKFHALTWKAGLVWRFNDMLTLRATHSKDFRAPNLADLYLPGRTQGLATVTDFLTGAIAGQNGYNPNQQVGGNPNLKPENSRTTTVGIVLKPAHNFSVALDYYNIKIDNAITTIDGGSQAVQKACYDSGGSSPFCSLQVRPSGYTNTSTANNATLWYTASPLNIAKLSTHGLDLEMNYATELAGQPLSLRFLGSWQPTLRSEAPPSTPTDAAGVSIAKLRLQGMIRYNLTDKIRLDWSTRWRSGLKNVDPLLGAQVAPGSLDVASASFSNLNISFQPQPNYEFYFNVQNVFDKTPPTYVPIAGTSALASGAGTGGVGFYPSDDGIGRYFIVGVRMKF